MLKLTPKSRVLSLRKFTFALVALFGVFSLVFINLQKPQLANAASSNTVNFQARLQTATGGIVPDGTYNVEFKLYSASSNGTALWTEDYLAGGGHGLQTINGYLSAQLGSLTSFPSTINWDQQLWLTMNIGGTSTSVVASGTNASGWDGEMNPRLPLTAVPYSLSAGQLQTTNGSNTSKLSIQAPTGGNQTFSIQDQGAAGTYNILTAPSGSDGYVKLQGSSPSQQTGYLNISGTATTGGLVAPSLQAASSVGLTLTGNNASTWSTSSGALTISGAGGLSLASGTVSTVAIDSGTTGAINIGTSSNGKNITIGNSTGTTSIALKSGSGGITLQGQSGTIGIGNNAAAQTISIGNTTGATAVNLTAGSGNITIAAPSTTFKNTTANSGITQFMNNLNQPYIYVDNSEISNYLNYSNFEAGTTGWSAVGSASIGAMTASPSASYSGEGSLLLTTTAVAGQGASTTSFAVTPSTTGVYNLSFYAEMVTGTMASNLLQVVSNDGATHTASCNSGTTLNTNGFQRVICSFTTTGTITKVSITQSDATARQLYIDGVVLMTGSITYPYSENAGISLYGSIQSPLLLDNGSLSTAAFAVQGASTTTLIADTLNNHVGIGTSTPAYTLDVGGDINSSANLRTGGTTRLDNAGNLSNIGNLVMSGNFTQSNGTFSLAGNAASSVSTTTGTLTFQGAGSVSINTTAVAAGSSAITIQTGNASAGTAGIITIDNGTSSTGTGTVNIGNTNAKSVVIGNTTGATAIALKSGSGGITIQGQSGTIGIGNNAAAQTISIGNSTGATAINLTAGTGGISITGSTTATGSFQIRNGASNIGGIQFQGASNQPFLTTDTTYLVNYLTYGDFESGSTGWTAVNSATVSPNIGTSSLVFTGIGGLNLTTTAVAGQGASTTNFISSPNTVGAYTFSFYALMNSGTMASNLWQVTSNDGATHTATCNAGTTLSTSGYQRVVCSFTTTGTITKITIAQTDATARTVYIDGAMLNTGSVQPYVENSGLSIMGSIQSPLTINNQSLSTAAFTVQGASGSTNFIADTLDNRIGIATSAPAYTLDVGGDINSSTTVRVGGTSGATLSSSALSFSGAGSIQAAGTNSLNLDTAGAGTVTFGNVNASTILIGESNIAHTIRIGDASTSATQTINIGSPVGSSSIGIAAGSGGVAITANSTGSVLLQANSGGSGVVAKSVTNSTAAFMVQNASSVSLFTVDTTNSTITLGSVLSGNYISFSSTGGLVAYGSAQHTKSILLTPQYNGAVLDAQSDSACASANSGTLTNGFDSTAIKNYYNWTSASGTAQCYDIIVQVPLPADFAGWSQGSALFIQSYSTDNSIGKIAIAIDDTNGNSAYSYADCTPGNSNTWSNLNYANVPITSWENGGTWTPGTAMTLHLRVTSQSGANVRLGNIRLNYKSMF